MAKQILHDAHREHPLVLRRVASAGFRCSGCGCNGAGFRYRCDACDFDLHESCVDVPAVRAKHGLSRRKGTSSSSASELRSSSSVAVARKYSVSGLGQHPPTALLPVHGQHPLTFEPTVASDAGRVCDLCDTRIKGMHYRCRPTGFDVHPVCSQMPAAAISPLHPEHLVVLTAAGPTKCTRCGRFCSWRYRCNPCEVSLHPRCLLGSDKTPLGIPKTACYADSSCDEASDLD